MQKCYNVSVNDVYVAVKAVRPRPRVQPCAGRSPHTRAWRPSAGCPWCHQRCTSRWLDCCPPAAHPTHLQMQGIVGKRSQQQQLDTCDVPTVEASLRRARVPEVRIQSSSFGSWEGSTLLKSCRSSLWASRKFIAASTLAAGLQHVFLAGSIQKAARLKIRSDGTGRPGCCPAVQLFETRYYTLFIYCYRSTTVSSKSIWWILRTTNTKIWIDLWKKKNKQNPEVCFHSNFIVFHDKTPRTKFLGTRISPLNQEYIKTHVEMHVLFFEGGKLVRIIKLAVANWLFFNFFPWACSSHGVLLFWGHCQAATPSRNTRRRQTETQSVWRARISTNVCQIWNFSLLRPKSLLFYITVSLLCVCLFFRGKTRFKESGRLVLAPFFYMRVILRPCCVLMRRTVLNVGLIANNKHSYIARCKVTSQCSTSV